MEKENLNASAKFRPTMVDLVLTHKIHIFWGDSYSEAYSKWVRRFNV